MNYQQALEYIHDNSTIYIDPSSTAIYLGVLLKTKKNIILRVNLVEQLFPSKFVR